MSGAGNFHEDVPDEKTHDHADRRSIQWLRPGRVPLPLHWGSFTKYRRSEVMTSEGLPSHESVSSFIREIPGKPAIATGVGHHPLLASVSSGPAVLVDESDRDVRQVRGDRRGLRKP